MRISVPALSLSVAVAQETGPSVRGSPPLAARRPPTGKMGATGIRPGRTDAALLQKIRGAYLVCDRAEKRKRSVESNEIPPIS